MADITKILCEGAWQGPSTYQEHYIGNFTEIQALLNGKGKGVATVSGNGVPEIEDIVKLSLLYNEVSALRITTQAERMTIGWLADGALQDESGSKQVEITVPRDISDEAIEAIKLGNVGFSFALPDSDEIRSFFNDAGRLISSGRLIVEPDRLLFYTTGEKNDQGGVNWHALPAEVEGVNLKQWRVKKVEDAQSRGLTTVGETTLPVERRFPLDIPSTEIVLPIIRGVGLADYASIIQDEGDLLEDFRSEMRTFEKTLLLGEKSIDEIRDDVLAPRIAKIDRAFGRITRMRAINTSGAFLATGALVVTAVATQGAAAAIAAAAGGAGFIKSLKEWADGAAKLDELRDDPAYLLWKLRRANAKPLP